MRRLIGLVLVATVALALTEVASPGNRHDEPPQPESAQPRQPPLPAEVCIPELPAEPPPDELERMLDGWVKIRGFDPVNLGRDIDWSADPFDHASFQATLHSMEWVRPLLSAAAAGDARAATRATAILSDWLDDHQGDAEEISEYAWSERPAGLRTRVLACTVAVLGESAEFVEALRAHAVVLADPENYAGEWNHGLDQDIGVLVAACVLNDQGLWDAAVQRATDTSLAVVTAEGVTTEQAIGYHEYNYRQLGWIIEIVRACGGEADERLIDRHGRMPSFLAHATTPQGVYGQLGDVYAMRPRAGSGTEAEFAATGGQRGRKPATRSAIYEASGYAFGRTGWGAQRPFEEESWFALRFGPPRQIHGHHDHMSVLYAAHGENILTEGGFSGYDADPYLAWLRGPAAHNVVVAPNAAGAQWRNPHTELVEAKVKGTSHRFELRDQPYDDVVRTRNITIDLETDRLVVRDRMEGSVPRVYEQLWHLPPGAAVQLDRTTVRARVGSAEVIIRQLLPVGRIEVVQGQVDPFQGWVSREFRQREEAPVVVSRVRQAVAEWQTEIEIRSLE